MPGSSGSGRISFLSDLANFDRCATWPIWASTHLNHSLGACLLVESVGWQSVSVIGYAPANLKPRQSLITQLLLRKSLNKLGIDKR